VLNASNRVGRADSGARRKAEQQPSLSRQRPRRGKTPEDSNGAHRFSSGQLPLSVLQQCGHPGAQINGHFLPSAGHHQARDHRAGEAFCNREE